MSSAATPSSKAPVVVVSSNKGGVGKTTVAANLAIYLRALREDLPVLLVGLDDQHTIDRMLALRPLRPGEGHLKHGWAERNFRRVVQLGEYGVHYVPAPPDTALLKARAEDPRTLQRILDQTAWEGIVILDTKSDLEALTLNAIHAADRVIVPVADWASLEEAGRLLRMLDRAGIDVERARIVFTLVDKRVAQALLREAASCESSATVPIWSTWFMSRTRRWRTCRPPMRWRPTRPRAEKPTSSVKVNQ